MASFMAAGTSYANTALPTIPFYIFYSIFGFQRVGDMIWACADALCKGFLLGGTAGRTTLNGEGLQHQDGHSPLIASTVPSIKTYDPAYAYEVAVIIRHGIDRMYAQGHAEMFYLMLYNQSYPMPAMPDDCEDGIIRGLYCIDDEPDADIHLIGSGSLMTEVEQACETLRQQGRKVSLWSATSYIELQRQAHTALELGERPFVTECFADRKGVIVATSDYMKALPNSIAPYMPLPFRVLARMVLV